MSSPIGLGIPDGPPPVLHPRRKTRQLHVGPVGVGSDYPISVQSMTNTKTHDINGTLQQIAQLTASGCDIVRVACPKPVDAEALPTIARSPRSRSSRISTSSPSTSSKPSMPVVRRFALTQAISVSSMGALRK